MARTHGHGNPDWTRDETILALDLYFVSKGHVPSAHDPRIKELSGLLRSMPFHELASRKDSFRNPDGVAFKLQNLRQVATGKGLGNVSKMDRQVWAELGSTPEEVRRLSDVIRAGIKIAESTGRLDDDGEEEFLEGRVLTALHKKRERNPKVRRMLLKARRKAGRPICEMCLSTCMSTDKRLEDAMFEAHHLIPISSAMTRKTSLQDLALLCANCHSILHRAISVERRWLGVSEGRKLLSSGGIK